MHHFNRYYIRSMLAAMLAIALGGLVHAQDLRFGASYAPVTGADHAITLSAAFPLLTIDQDETPLGLAVRADVSVPVSFDTLPSFGAVLLLEGIDGQVRPYVGTGVALGWRTIDAESTLLVAWTLVGGVAVRVTDTIAVRSEVAVAPLVRGTALSIGVDWAPWR